MNHIAAHKRDLTRCFLQVPGIEITVKTDHLTARGCQFACHGRSDEPSTADDEISHASSYPLNVLARLTPISFA